MEVYFERLVDKFSRNLKQREFPLSNTDFKTRLIKDLTDVLSELTEDQMDYVDQVVKEYSDTSVFDSDLLSVYNTPNKVWVGEKELLSDDYAPYWRAFISKLSNNPHMSEEDIKSITYESLAIVNKLEPPISSRRVKNKGLVYGNVQSGKTASMCAVIAQYATMGCKLVIVLSGTTDKLRDQTQKRMIKDLCIEDGVGEGYSWKLITNPSDAIARRSLPLSADMNSLDKTVLIGVFKKNASILRRLNDYYITVPENGKENVKYNRLPVLIIDDECDQASPNVGKGSDNDERSAINRELVRMIGAFPFVSYIGYTATPFANVLNEAPSENSLYPSSFIAMLKEKKNYYGASALFGLGEEFEEYQDEKDQNLDIIDDSLDDSKDSPIPYAKIRESIVYFLTATGVREWRGQQLNDSQMINQHSTMMIHTSGITIEHKSYAEAVEKIVSSLKTELASSPLTLCDEVVSVWNKVYKKKRDANIRAIEQNSFTTPIENYIIPEDREIFGLFRQELARVEIKTDNYSTPMEDRLDYPDDKACCYIVVGGNTLSRGFTLIGLLVTLFTRRVNTYDALLQMGRWFGYRIGYEDLPRLWMSKGIHKKFMHLTGIEYDLKTAIQRYSSEGATPTELAIPIRTTPHFQIVRKKAMRDFVRSSINYSGRRPQTISFINESEWLLKNKRACERLVADNIACLSKYSESELSNRFIEGYLLEDISSKSVELFLNTYQFAENNNGLDKDLLLKYKEQAEKNMGIKWNLVVKSLQKPKSDPIDVGGLTVNRLERAKINDDDSNLNLKAIASPTDILCCVDKKCLTVPLEKLDNPKKFAQRSQYFKSIGETEPCVIIMYPIYSQSHPSKKGSSRKDLNAKEDVFGISIVFPNISRKSNMNTYDSVSIDLSNYSSAEEDDDD